jgi:hypothetical protein
MFTAVQGPNGAGKTPIMKGIVQGLGHEVELPPEVLQRCHSAQTTLLVDGRAVVLTRRLDTAFEMRIEDGDEPQIFTSQAGYARWFNGLFSSEARTLTTKQNQLSELYASVMLPAFWVDQDHGWTTDYWTPPNRNFIQDQRQEVIRYLVGLPARHPFRERTDFDTAKDTLERVEKTIEMQRFIIDRLRTNERLEEDEEAELTERRLLLRQELDANREIIEAIRGTTMFYDREITALETRRDDLTARQNILAKRRSQLSLVLSELAGEEDILTANVQSTDLLRLFCAREGCQMFATSERSFGRSLLFLKDQIKDLRTSDRNLGRDVGSLEEQIATIDEALLIKRAERQRAVTASPQGEVMGKLGALTKDIVDVELRLAKVQQYASEKEKFNRLLDKREQALAAVADTRPGRGKSATAVDDVRQLLGESMQEWLVTLGTQNTKTAHFDENFVLHVDGTKFSTTTHQSGSTRTRIVLAFHAALLEVSLARGGNHPGWLLFDAPKQHELNQADFDAYADRLHIISTKYPQRVQIVFSVADLKTQFYAGDKVWIPTYTLGESSRFLGPPEQK